MTRSAESASEWTRWAPPRMLRAAEERLAPAAWAARVEVALEEHRLLGLSRDEEMTETCVTNIADNVKPPYCGRLDRSEETNGRCSTVEK